MNYHLRTPTLMRGAPEELMKYSLFGKGPAVTLDGESFGESAYVIHRLLADSRLTVNNAELETSPSNDSTFWTTAAESAGMLWFQMYAMVNAGAKAWIDGREGDAKPEERDVLERFREWYCQEICWPQGQNFISKVGRHLISLMVRRHGPDTFNRSNSTWPLIPARTFQAMTSLERET